MKDNHRRQTEPGFRAQAIVEFALVLPILMMLLVGIFEVGRMIYTYAAVNNASREAARFGSALGYDDAGYHKYKDCEGIRTMARRSAYFTTLTIEIKYDQGPAYALAPFAWCDLTTTGEDNDFTLTTNDRIGVQVTASYSPLIKLIPFPSRTFTSTSYRTFLGSVEVGQSPSSGSGSGFGNTPTPTVPTTATATVTATANSTFTATATAPIVLATPTFLPSSTPTLIPTNTKTATPSATATSTSTPTNTSTPVSSCSSITASDINVTNGSNVISMTITNPYVAVTVSGISLQWDKNGAQGNPKTLTLDSANLGTTFWSGLNDSTGSYTITPTSTLTIPGNNTTSSITFTFVQNYLASRMSGVTTITINLSTPGCSAITKIAN